MSTLTRVTLLCCLLLAVGSCSGAEPSSRRFVHPGLGYAVDLPDFNRFLGDEADTMLFAYSLIRDDMPIALVSVKIRGQKPIDSVIAATEAEFVGTSDQIYSQARKRIAGREAIVYDLDSQWEDSLLRCLATEIAGSDYNILVSCVALRDDFSKYAKDFQRVIDSVELAYRFDEATNSTTPVYQDPRYGIRISCPEFTVSDSESESLVAQFWSPHRDGTVILVKCEKKPLPQKEEVLQPLQTAGWTITQASRNEQEISVQGTQADETQRYAVFDRHVAWKDHTIQLRALSCYAAFADRVPQQTAILDCFKSLRLPAKSEGSRTFPPAAGS